MEFIKEVQTRYKADIFGFGAKLRQEEPAVWKKVKDRWENIFQDLKVNVDVEITTRNSAKIFKRIQMGG